jgi:hypothetical protein
MKPSSLLNNPLYIPHNNKMIIDINDDCTIYYNSELNYNKDISLLAYILYLAVVLIPLLTLKYNIPILNMISLVLVALPACVFTFLAYRYESNKNYLYLFVFAYIYMLVITMIVASNIQEAVKVAK